MLDTHRVASSDSEWEVMLEHVEDGATLGASYYEVHLHAPNAIPSGHGNDDSSVVFYIRSEQRGYDRPLVEWVAARRLRVKYPNLMKPGKMINRLDDVEIEYEPFALPLGCTESVL